MKKIVLSAIALFFGISFASAQSYGPNLVTNGDFETQSWPLNYNTTSLTTSSLPLLTDLTLGVWYRNTDRIAREQVNVISGSNTLVYNVSTSTGGAIDRKFDLEPNTVYKLTATGRVQDVAGQSLQTNTNVNSRQIAANVKTSPYWNNNATTIGQNVITISSAVNATVSGEFTTGVIGTVTIRINLAASTPVVTGYIDDIKIEKKLATITTSVNDVAMGTVTPTATVNWGPNTTIVASPESGYQFDNWTEGTNVVSTAASYTFAATADRTLVANFSKITTSIDQSKSAIKVYAVGHNVFVEGGQMVEVYNLAGNLVKREQLTNSSFKIDQKGAYLLRIQSANGVSNHKIVIQ